MLTSKLTLAGICLLTASLFAHAAPPYHPDLVREGNRWTITAYDDSSTVHAQWATQGICFYPAGVRGTHQLYYWVSDTFPDWNGLAAQEGDQVFMHGDYDKDQGHDGMQFEIVTSSPKNEGYGHWHEWREDGRLGRTIGFVNAKLMRVGKCRGLTYAEALDIGSRLELQLNEQKEYIVSPFGLSEEQIKLRESEISESKE